jgi:ribosome-associated protein
MKPTPDDTPADGAERPSKTQLKKAMHELQSLGKDLLELPDSRLQSIPMPESLRQALQELKRTRSHEGRRRQLQYVGKLMRSADAEPLREAVAAQQLGSARDTLALHEAERWRERLLASDDALTEWLGLHPQSDAQSLRTLIRNARRESPESAPPESAGRAPRKGRSYRELFRTLSEQLRDAASPGGAEGEDTDEDAEEHS